MEKYTVTFGSKIIEFELIIKNVENLNIKITPEMSIIVIANKNMSIESIKEAVKSKISLILKYLEYFQKTQKEKKEENEYISGESLIYLGKQYRLKIQQSDKEEVILKRGYLYLFTKNKTDTDKKENLIKNWYKERTILIFNELLNKIYPYFERHNINKPDLSIRVMKTRWGSCLNNKNKIILNSDLIKVPKYCIEYVIAHELTHFIYPNHNKAFYNFISLLIPDWKKIKTHLDETALKKI